jgi:5'-3' exoribonuclease 1
MLGLVTHEPHFTLLREVIDFNFHHSSSSTNALKAIQKFTKQSEFQLLHLSILREYLFYEFAQLASSSPSSSTSIIPTTTTTTTTIANTATDDLERIIDDFVFLTFFVGNDFLPHTLDIADNAFELLFDTYRKQRPTWGQGQYLVDTGHISSPRRLEHFLQEIGSHESSIIEEREKREAEHRKKTDFRNRRNNHHYNNNKHSGNTNNNKNTSTISMQAEYAKQEQIKQANYFSMLSNVSSFSDTPTSNINNSNNNNTDDETNNSTLEGRKDYKGRYYFEKLGFTPTDLSKHKALQKSYLEGLMWCLAYYYRGCISWGWYFPYHYGPMLSDLKDLSTYFTQITFELSEPLKPFQQLMGCLPPASATLVPQPYRNLMTSHSSPILHFYPTDFQIDMEGKRNPWEGINLLEFIDIQLLKETLEHHCPDTLLTPEEKARNTFGNVYIYTYDATVTETIPSFQRNYFPDITQCHSHVAVVKSNHFQIDIPFRPTLVSGTVIPAPGYPSLKALPVISVECLPLGLNCFGMPSKYSTMVLNLQELPPDLPSARLLADKILGKHVYINYPMMHEAKVVAISDKHGEVRLVIHPNTTPKKKKTSLMKKITNFSETESDQWISESETLQEQYMRGVGIPGTGGLTIGPVRIRLSLKLLQGMKISPVDGSSKKIFGNEEADIPLQTALWQNPAPDPRFSERGPKRWKDLFPSGCRVLLTKGKYKGCMGTIITTTEEAGVEGDANKRVITQVQIIPPDPPFGLAIARSVKEAYLSVSEVADVLKMNPRVIGRIFGSLLVEPGRYDLGLNLRYQSNYCVIGYTQYVLKVPKKNDTVQEKAAWTPGDAVRVIGSHKITTLPAAAQDTANSRTEEGYWQYTPKVCDSSIYFCVSLRNSSHSHLIFHYRPLNFS